MAKIEIKQLTEKTTDLTKNIWFAGLGAYGKILDGAQDRYEKANKEMARLFDELIAKGKNVEVNLQEKTTEIKDKSSTTLEQRYAQVKNNLKFSAGKAALDNQLKDVSKKLDQVINALETKKTEKKVSA